MLEGYSVSIDAGQMLRYFFLSEFSIAILAIYAVRMDLAIKASPSYYKLEDDTGLKFHLEREMFVDSVNKNFHFNRISLFLGGTAFVAILFLTIAVGVKLPENASNDRVATVVVGGFESMAMVTTVSSQIIFIIIAFIWLFARPLAHDIVFSWFAPYEHTHD